MLYAFRDITGPSCQLSNFHIWKFMFESGGVVYISMSVLLTWEVERSFAAFGRSCTPGNKPLLVVETLRYELLNLHMHIRVEAQKFICMCASGLQL